MFMTYVADSLRFAGENKYISAKWIDLVHPTPEVKAEEIVADIVSRAGLVMV